MNTTKKVLFEANDAFNNKIVIGKIYAYTKSSDGYSFSTIGVACNISKTGRTTLTVIETFGSSTADSMQKINCQAEKVSVKSNLLIRSKRKHLK